MNQQTWRYQPSDPMELTELAGDCFCTFVRALNSGKVTFHDAEDILAGLLAEAVERKETVASRHLAAARLLTRLGLHLVEAMMNDGHKAHVPTTTSPTQLLDAIAERA